MARVLALSATLPQRLPLPDAPGLRSLVVLALALALICAERPLPLPF